MEKINIAELAFASGYLADIRMHQNKEYDDLRNGFEELISELCNEMNDKQKYEMLIKFEDAYLGMELLSNTEFFKRGFKLGLTIAAQSFLD